MEGERRLGAFVVVQRFGSQPIAAAAGREVVERLAQPVAAEEPFERLDRPAPVLAVARDGERSQLGLDERCSVDRLLVAGTRRRLAPAASEMTRMVALGISCARQIARMICDSISTASAPVALQRACFSATVVATRSAQ